MNVQAISSVSSPSFAGKAKKPENKKVENNRPQMDSPASKNSVNSMRSLIYGLMALGAAATGSSIVSSCAEAEAIANAQSSIEVTMVGHECKHGTTIIHDTIHHHHTDTIVTPPDTIYKTDTIVTPPDTIYKTDTIVAPPDTIYKTDTIVTPPDTIYKTDTIVTPPDTIYVTDTIHERDTIVEKVIETIIQPVNVKEYPIHLGDSLLAQGLNIGIPLDGPKPNGDDVIFVGSKAYNRYDAKLYETKVDSIGTNKRQLSLVTKVIDLYDSENPRVTWMKTNITDVPGKGIKLERFVSNDPIEPGDHDQWKWNYAGYEIRSNGGRGNKPGVNTVYDNAGNLVWKGEYTNKGCAAGAFMFGTLVYDENGNPYRDEDGNPETASYDFNQAQMWSDKIKLVEVPNPEFGKFN